MVVRGRRGAAMRRGLLAWLAACAVAGCGPAGAPAGEGTPPEHGVETAAADGGGMSDADIRAMLDGDSAAAAEPLPMSWRRLVSDVEAGRIALTPEGVPEGMDTRRDKASDGGLFQVRLQAPDDGVVMNRIATWEIHVRTPEGAPVQGARIDVVGGMPLHNHGFPTEPRVGAERGPGVYPLQGVRLGMRGWWQVLLAISAGGQTDTVAFDLVVTP